ncbi:MAG: hypothetical protein AB1705_22465 [Verrucomicrobiota bacterium]
MNTKTIWLCCGLALALAACGKKPEAHPPTLAPEPEAKPLSVVPETPPPGAPPLPPGKAPDATVVAPTVAGAATNAAASLAGTVAPLEDDDGKPLTDTLAIMQRAADIYNDYRFASVEEEDDEPWPALTDLSLLVKYKVLRALPAPPPGKRFVYDKETGKVTLAGP